MTIPARSRSSRSWVSRYEGREACLEHPLTWPKGRSASHWTPLGRGLRPWWVDADLGLRCLSVSQKSGRGPREASHVRPKGQRAPPGEPASGGCRRLASPTGWPGQRPGHKRVMIPAESGRRAGVPVIRLHDVRPPPRAARVGRPCSRGCPHRGHPGAPGGYPPQAGAKEAGPCLDRGR